MQKKMRRKLISGFLLLLGLIVTACTPSANQIATQTAAAATMTATAWTQTPTPSPSKTATLTPTASATPTATATPTAVLPSSTPVSLGATRDEIQAIYKQLGVEFNPPEVIEGQPVVVGGYVNNNVGNEILVFVRIVGRPMTVQEASVTVYIPWYLAITPKVGARQHEKVMFALRQLLDVVIPDWKEGPEWLDKSFRGFGSVTETRQAARTQIGTHIIVLDAEIVKLDQVETISTALTVMVDR